MLAQQRRIVQWLEAGLPLAVVLGETQAQGIVVFNHGAKGGFQLRHLYRVGRLEQYGLVPVRRLGDIHFEETHLGGQQRGLAADGGVHGCSCNYRLFGLDALGHLGQLGDGLLLEQLLGSDLDTLALGPGDDLQAEDGIAAQLEEVVAATNLLQLQYIGPHGGQFLFDLTFRRHVATADRAGYRQRAFV